MAPSLTKPMAVNTCDVFSFCNLGVFQFFFSAGELNRMHCAYFFNKNVEHSRILDYTFILKCRILELKIKAMVTQHMHEHTRVQKHIFI